MYFITLCLNSDPKQKVTLRSESVDKIMDTMRTLAESVKDIATEFDGQEQPMVLKMHVEDAYSLNLFGHEVRVTEDSALAADWFVVIAGACALQQVQS